MMISGDPAVRRELDNFERVQLWTVDPNIGDLAEKQRDLMQEKVGTTASPQHAIVAPDGTVLVHYEYRGPLSTPEDYMEFLREGEAKFEKR
jgi:hypothetical protein